ncbi:MAG: NAD-dependent deacylase [Bacteroidales bacterium]|nr:NAD-dependent deacylase [Bacteroidales bacterium]MDD4683895.1 NAD-dependent deacylase [Bacteroidales bacterium]
MKNIVVLTGAGISKESGIDTFRDSDGLWENHRVEDVANFDSWVKDPVLVRNFYNERRKQVIEASPNQAHKDLVRLEKHFNVNIITQNIDDFHERAGSSNIIHLHGEIKKVQSVRDPDFVIELEGWELTENDKDMYGEPLRPHIVWFGEAVPMIEPSIELCQNADIFIIIGTSLAVYPAAGLIHYTPSTAKKYLIDPNDVKGDLRGIKFVQEKASLGVKRVVDEILLENKIFEN